jgi:hypothetical protein
MMERGHPMHTEDDNLEKILYDLEMNILRAFRAASKGNYKPSVGYWQEAKAQIEAQFVSKKKIEKLLEPEELPSWKDWYSKTKPYGGTKEEYLRLQDITNSYNNLRAELRKELLDPTGQLEDKG